MALKSRSLIPFAIYCAVVSVLTIFIAFLIAFPTGVLAALEAMRARLPVTAQAVRLGLALVELPGRFQVVPGQPALVLDVAHNPHSVAALALNLDPAPASARRAAHRDAPSAEQALAALRENHRQIREMVAAPGAEPAPAPTELAPSPRSEVRPFTPTTINPAKTSIAYECA